MITAVIVIGLLNYGLGFALAVYLARLESGSGERQLSTGPPEDRPSNPAS